VTENVAFGLRMRRVGAAEIARRVQAMLAVVRLDHLAERYPNQLSGGQQQRVALARALVIEPSILILDEPFGALDRKLREAMQAELRQITSDLGITTLFVTHDQEEALMLSDLIAVMNQGRVEQFGTPQEVFRTPRTRFVADFMGVTNFIKARWSGGRLLAGNLILPALAAPGGDGSTVELAIRPEEIMLQPRSGDALPAEVVQFFYHGTSTSYTLRLPDGQLLTAREANDGDAAIRFGPGDLVSAYWQPGAVHLLQA
jgi:ABC-type Fe3+/spermidine/putrescine transport system ATPase subunit